MPDFFEKKTVLVTGGTDGIGKALVDELLARGAQVSTCGRNHDKLYNLQTRHASAFLHTMLADVSREQDCRRLVDMTLKVFGGIDIVINNAGISMRAELQHTTPDVIRQVMEVNFFGTVYATHFALPSILERKGSIVAISSIAGYRGLPGRSGYSASKHALHGWVESIRTELVDDGVHVLLVCPGFTTSNIRKAALNAEGKVQGESPMDENKMMSAEECARIILRSIEQKKREVIMTFQGKRTVWLNKLFPGFTDKMVRKFYYKEGKLVK